MSWPVDVGTTADVIVFKSVRFQVSTQIRYVRVSICIHFQQRFQIDAFSMNTLSVLVWTEGQNASKCMRFQTKTH